MIKEAYCSYELSKLLKERGFDWDCNAIYGKKGEFQRNTDRAFNNGGLHVTSAPTHQMAMKWLREVYHMHILSEISDPSVVEPKYYCMIWNTLNGNSYIVDLFDSYEEAVEAALKYTLENLI